MVVIVSSRLVRVGRGTVAALMLGLSALALVGCTPAQSSVTVANRTLLTHTSTGTSADALGFGILGANSQGCVTMGASVLVVPDDSHLLSDGSIQVDGQTYKIGSKIQLGGGSGSRPAGSHCGAGRNYFWVG
jgi:hypothetical protein